MRRILNGTLLAVLAGACIAANAAPLPPLVVPFRTDALVWDIAVRPDGTALVVGYQTAAEVTQLPALDCTFQDCSVLTARHAVVYSVSPDGSYDEIFLGSLVPTTPSAAWCISPNGEWIGGSSGTVEAPQYYHEAVDVACIWNIADLQSAIDIGQPRDLPVEISGGVTFGISNNGIAVGLQRGSGDGFVWSQDRGYDTSFIDWFGFSEAYTTAISGDGTRIGGESSLYTGDGWYVLPTLWDNFGPPYVLTLDNTQWAVAVMAISPNGRYVAGGYGVWEDGVFPYENWTDEDFQNISWYGGNQLNDVTDSGIVVGGGEIGWNYTLGIEDQAGILFLKEKRSYFLSSWLRDEFGIDLGTLYSVRAIAQFGDNIYLAVNGPPAMLIRLPYVDPTTTPELVETDITGEVSITRTDAVTSSATQTNVPVRLSIRLFGRTFNIDFSAPVVSGVTVTNDAFVSVENTSAGTVTAPINLAVTPGDPEVTGGGTQVLQTDGTFEVGQGLGGGVTLTKTASYTLPTGRLTLEQYMNLLQTTSQWASQQRQTVGQYDVAVTGLLPTNP